MAGLVQIHDQNQNSLTAVPTGEKRTALTINDKGTTVSFIVSPESWNKLKRAVEGHFNRPKINWWGKVDNGKTDAPNLLGECDGKPISIHFANKTWSVDYEGRRLKGGFKGREKAIKFIEEWISANASDL